MLSQQFRELVLRTFSSQQTGEETLEQLPLEQRFESQME
jgi:hypothetical protein